MTNAGNISDNLKRAGKKNPFLVPEGYFEGFQDRLHENMRRQIETTGHKKVMLTWKTWAAAAAIIIASVIAGNLMLRNPADLQLNKEITQLLEEQLYSINEQTIMEVMENSTDISAMQPEVNSEEMIEYLINQNITENEMVN